MSDHIALGQKAENLACKHLKKRGYKILEKNLRLVNGEIDILALDGDVLVIVEVKATSDPTEFGPAYLHVGPKKIAKLRRLALGLMQSKKIRDRSIRFDVVSVDFSTKKADIEIIENAIIQG